MLRYQRGDREAFALLVRRHEVRVYNFSLRHVRDERAAEDIAQDAFLRVVRKASEFKHEARFSTWLYTIVRNLCVDHLRRMKHRRHTSLDDSPPGEERPLVDKLPTARVDANVERRAVSTEVGSKIVAAIESLPEEQREVFLLRELAGMPFADIADLTGVSANTVKSRMRYALDRLKEALSQFEEYARALR